MSRSLGRKYLLPMADPNPSLRALQQPLVLVVDDEPLMRRILTVTLQDDYRVLAAGDAREALDMFDTLKRDIAAVVTDIRLPEIDGISFAATMRQTGESPPILFISGYAAPAEAPGPFLAKPFTPDDLLGALRRLIAGYPPPARKT